MLPFFRSLNVSPLNSKYLENSKSTSCRVGRKNTRKSPGNVTKNGKALLVKIREIGYVAKKFECQCRILAYYVLHISMPIELCITYPEM